MEIFEIFILGIVLSLDTLAFIICSSLSFKKIRLTHILLISLIFGLSSTIMPILGYYLAELVSDYLININKILSFGVLSFMGIKTIKDSLDEDNKNTNTDNIIDFIPIALLTSIDSFFIGLTLAFINTNILIPSLTLGICSTLAVIIGIALGSKFQKLFNTKAPILGGLFMILLGLKMLLL